MKQYLYDIRNATGTGNNNFHKIFRIKNKSLLLPRHKAKVHVKVFSQYKRISPARRHNSYFVPLRPLAVD